MHECESLMVDLRSRLLPVGDQGRRGTCVAFAATAAHEYLRDEGIHLSVEFLHWSAKQRDGFGLSEEGTTLEAAVAALAEAGQPPEIMWPYDDTRDQRAASYCPSDEVVKDASCRRVLRGTALGLVSTIVQTVLAAGTPVLLGLRLFSTWHYLEADDAKIRQPPPELQPLGGHAVLVVGFGELSTEVGRHFLIRNSWGADWGQNGYAFLPYDYVDAHAIAIWQLSE